MSKRQPAGGVSVSARSLTKTVKGDVTVLQDVTLGVEPGELVAVVGGSGAGKTTLLEALAGISPTDSGSVEFDGVEVGNGHAFRSSLGYVPQDDILHLELPLERTLGYAARLRLPAKTESSEADARVQEVVRSLDLTERAGTVVGALSGGQRKRASIAVEMLTDPRIFFLDEPTSGLDPVTSSELLRVLRKLADGGATVIFTTHAIQDLTGCDRVIFLARGGRLAFVGTVADALSHFDVSSVDQIYARLGQDEERVAGDGRAPGAVQPLRPEPSGPLSGPHPVSSIRQWAVLSARSFEAMARNRLTLAILLGSPVMVVAMFAILFKQDAFDFSNPSPTAVLMIVFWITFGSFFFGLTYGLLQIVTERAILRREYLVGLRLGSYLLSKVTVLLPFLIIVNVLMILVLRGLDRLPAESTGTYVSICITLTLDALAALMMGLLASAAVSNPSQATLALPMLCFPAVLFSGAILPVHVMAQAGAWISVLMPDRWAFEAVGHDLGVRQLFLEGGSPLGPPLVQAYGAAGLEPTGTYWAYLAIFSVVFFASAWLVLKRRLRSPNR